MAYEVTVLGLPHNQADVPSIWRTLDNGSKFGVFRAASYIFPRAQRRHLIFNIYCRRAWYPIPAELPLIPSLRCVSCVLLNLWTEKTARALQIEGGIL